MKISHDNTFFVNTLNLWETSADSVKIARNQGIMAIALIQINAQGRSAIIYFSDTYDPNEDNDKTKLIITDTTQEALDQVDIIAADWAKSKENVETRNSSNQLLQQFALVVPIDVILELVNFYSQISRDRKKIQ